jgi:PncC family amidohydrolase
LLIEKNITISAAESCTAGLFSSRLTQVAGISSVFPGSVVSYSNQVKNEVLGVKAETLARWGAVSEQTALEMAQGARAKFHTDCAVSITGIAGPGGGSEEKPVGLVYVCVNFKGKSRVAKNIYIGDRSMVRRRSVLTAFQILYGLLAFD